MIAIQVVTLLFAAFMGYLTLLHFRRGEFSRGELFFWQTLWVGLVIIVFIPHSLDFFLRLFRIYRTFDAVVVVALVIGFGLIFRTYTHVNRTERKVEELTRSMAFREAGLKPPGKPPTESRQ